MKYLMLSLALLMAMTCVSTSFAADKPVAPKEINVPMAERPIFAVVAFDDGSLQRQEWWGPTWDVGKGLSDMLVTVMMEKNRYRLLERSLLDKVMAEQDLGKTSRVDPASAAKLGKITGADYLIMGKVTEFSWEKKSGGLAVPIRGLSGLAGTNTKARVSVDLRVVDAETSEIVASYSGSAEKNKGSFAVGIGGIGVAAIGSSDFMNSILGQATREAISNWTDNMCRAQDTNKLMLTPKHKAAVRPDGTVLDVTGDTIIANVGTAKGYNLGDSVEVHKKGKELKDPDTGEVLRVMTEMIGTGTIVRIDQKTADIKIKLADKAKVPVVGDIIKSAVTETTAPTPAK